MFHNLWPYAYHIKMAMEHTITTFYDGNMVTITYNLQVENMESNHNSKKTGYLLTELDSNGLPHILYADDMACIMTGLDKEALLKLNPSQLPNHLTTTQTPLDSIRTLWILETPIKQVQEASEQRIAELTRQNAVLEDALRAAEETNKAKSRFLSNMSHDIRTPMNAIVGMSSIGLSHIDEKSRVQDCLNKILTASSHLMSLVNDVLDMSRIDSDRMTLNEEEFSLADLIHDISVIVRPQAAQKNQNLQIEIGIIHEECLLGDPLRLRQILVNIIGNAVKYTQAEGEIHVRFAQKSAPHIRTQTSDDSTRSAKKDDKIWLDFQCEDNGMGMSREFLKRIFDPFERVQNEATSKIEGTGLGMSIVKNLVERMNGEITVESEEGVGSCFRVELPFSAAPQLQKSLSLPQGASVLIAGSHNAQTIQMETYLKDGGLIPIHMESGLKTVTWLTEAQYENHMPCAMLLGHELTDMPILELASHIRQLAGREFPILLVSEEDWAQLEYRATRAGINAFVPCPLFKSKLLNTLSALTDNGQKGDSACADRSRDLSAYRLLLVEDIELNQEIAVELLSVTGVQVEVANNGAEAVEKFETSPEGYYDLIFMDIQMPVMNGYDAAKRIRQMARPDALNVWIVAMTANAFVEDIRLAREAGMNEHISKPVDPDRLQEILYRQFQ